MSCTYLTSPRVYNVGVAFDEFVVQLLLVDLLSRICYEVTVDE